MNNYVLTGRYLDGSPYFERVEDLEDLQYAIEEIIQAYDKHQLGSDVWEDSDIIDPDTLAIETETGI